jgi:hypothetical protein
MTDSMGGQKTMGTNSPELHELHELEINLIRVIRFNSWKLVFI